MKFDNIIGVSTNPKTKEIIRKAEEKLSSAFTELSLNYTNTALGSQIGGCPLTFQLLYSLPHIADITSIQLDEIREKEKDIKKKIIDGIALPEDKELSKDLKKYRKSMGNRVLSTAATDGLHFYYSPQFINGLSKLGVRFVLMHEAFHIFLCHVSRRGSRHPKLWNIANDYKVNWIVMEDLRTRNIKDYPQIFAKELGDYIMLEEYAAYLHDPFNPPERLKHLDPILNLRKMADPGYKNPYDDTPPMYFADANLSDDMKKPENIYSYLLSQIPKCPKCGRLGKYKKPEEYKKLQKQIEENRKKAQAEAAKKKEKEDNKKKAPGKGDEKSDEKADQHSHGDEEHNHEENGEPCTHGKEEKPADGKACEGGCSECGDGNCDGDGEYEYIDPFGAGNTLDDHIDSDVSEDELAKRIQDAVEMAKRIGGKIPAGLEDELGLLLAPKISWQDIVRQQLYKKRNGVGRNNWNAPKSRPMFAGLYIPKKISPFLNILVAYDCSGSMSQEDIAYGISQLQVIDDKAEMWLLPFDTTPYYDRMIKVIKADKENLMKTKVCGRGGTMVNEVFQTYRDNCGDVDLVIVITDSYLADTELRDCHIRKGTDVLWLVTSHNKFVPPFGRAMNIRNE